VREVTKYLCPLVACTEREAGRRCWEEDCAWWDVDDGCCCIRVLTRALEDVADKMRDENIPKIRKHGICDVCGREGELVYLGGYYICSSNECYKKAVLRAAAFIQKGADYDIDL